MKHKTCSRRRTALIILSVILLLAMLAAALLILRPDYAYRLRTGLRRATARNPLTPYTPEAVVEYIPSAGEIGDELLLISAKQPLAADRTIAVVEYRDTGLRMQAPVAESYAALAAAVGAATGQKLLIRDAYRTREEQADVYAADASVAALPGESEHEAGLALDVYISRFAGYGFLKSEAGRFVGDHCAEYGLIIRYPDGEKRITGAPYEPWHLRYVGAPHAQLITRAGLCFEEYLAFLDGSDFWQADGWVVSRQPVTGRLYIPAGASDITLSEDNCGYIVIACRVAG